jgi:hypothetical protein
MYGPFLTIPQNVDTKNIFNPSINHTFDKATKFVLVVRSLGDML